MDKPCEQNLSEGNLHAERRFEYFYFKKTWSAKINTRAMIKIMRNKIDMLKSIYKRAPRVRMSWMIQRSLFRLNYRTTWCEQEG